MTGFAYTGEGPGGGHVIIAVPHTDLDKVWPTASVELSKAIAHCGGRFFIDDLYKSLQARTAVLWIIVQGTQLRAAAMTRIALYPRKRAVSVDWIGGSGMSEWIPDFIRAMKSYAEANSCSVVECSGRPGWGKILPTHGWRQTHVSFEMGV